MASLFFGVPIQHGILSASRLYLWFIVHFEWIDELDNIRGFCPGLSFGVWNVECQWLLFLCDYKIIYSWVNRNFHLHIVHVDSKNVPYFINWIENSFMSIVYRFVYDLEDFTRTNFTFSDSAYIHMEPVHCPRWIDIGN